MTAQLENVGVYLARSSPVLSEHRYLSSVTDSSMLCIVESDGSHSISCHTLFQTWQPYLPDNCLKFGGASKLSQNSETTSPLARMPTDFIPSRGSIGSQQLFSVSKTAQDLINDYLEQETNPCRSVTVHPKRKIKVNQESQSNIDATPSSHKSNTHAQIIDCTAIGNISESTGVDAVTISSTDHFRVTASTSQNEASKNRGHVKSKVTARSAKSITHRHQSRSYVRRCHAHTWASRSQPVLDQSDSTGCPSLDVTAAAKSLGEALAAKLQALLYSGTSNRKCNCECDCQSSVGKECGTKCQDPLCKNKSMSDKQNDNNSSPGALCYKSVAQKSYFNEDVTSTVNKNISNAQDHPLCKPPCIGLLCGERYKCNEQLNKNTPMEVNISEAPSPAETQTPPLVPPLLKDYCTDSENCRVKTPELQARDASPATIVLKGPWPGPSKCINESLDPLTSCPGARKVKDTFKTFDQQCPSISPSAVSLSSRCPPSQVPPSRRLKGLKIEVQTRNVRTGSCLPSPALSFSSTRIRGHAQSRHKQNTSKNLRNIGVGANRPLSDAKNSQCCGPCCSFSRPAQSTLGTGTRPEIVHATQACGDDYMPKETKCLAACAQSGRSVKYITSGIKPEPVEKSTSRCKTTATKSVDTVDCCACVTSAKHLEERHTNTGQFKSSTATGLGSCCGDLGLIIIQQRGTDPGPELESGEIDESDSCYVIFKRTKTGLLRPCCAHKGLRKSKEKKCSCTGKSIDNVSKRPAIKISQSVAHKTRTATKKSTLRSCCSCTAEVQAKANISSSSIGVGSKICLERPACSASTNTSKCVIGPDPVKPKCCKTIETQINSPQGAIDPVPVNTKCCKTEEAQMSKKCIIPSKEVAKRKKTTNTMRDKCKAFCAKCCSCCERRSKMSPDRIPSKNESNCDKPLFPNNQNPATSDTCPSGLRFGDRSQAIKSQPATQPACENKSCREKSYGSKLDNETQPRSQAQNIETQMQRCINPSCPFTSYQTNNRTQMSKSQTKNRTQTSKSQTTSVESCKNPCCPFKGSELSDNRMSVESYGDPEFPFEDSQASENQPTSIDSCGSPNCPFRDLQTDRDQISSIESCANTDCPFKDSQTAENQTMPVEMCDNPCCPSRESQANIKTSSRRRSKSICPYHDTPANNNQPATQFCDTQPTNSCRDPCCRLKSQQIQNSATSRRTLETSQNNGQLYNNKKTHWAKSCSSNNTFQSKPENLQANSFRNSKANSQCTCYSRQRCPTNCKSVCCFEISQTNEHPPCTNSCPSADTQSYQTNDDKRYDENYCNDKCCPQESQTRSLESHYKPVHPYPSKHSSRKGMCLNFRPVAQKTLNYFSRPKYPPRPQKVNDYPSNPQEVRDYPHSSQEVGDYLTSPQELQRYHVNQHCEPPIPQDGISRPQGTQGCLTTPRRDPECPQGYSTCAQHGASRPQGYVTMPGCDPESPQGFSSSAQDSASRPQGNLTTPGCDPECTQGYSTCAQNGASRSQGTHGHLTSPGCNPECPRGYSTCAQHGASRPQGYVTMPGCDPESPQGFSSSAQDSASRPQGNLTTPGCDPECPQGYSTCAQNGASRLHGMQSYLTTPRCDPDCPHRCQKSVGPPYTERDVNRPAILSRSFAQTEYPYEEIKPEKRAKKKKVSGNLTKRKEIERGTDYPCAQVCQDDMAPSSSASSLNSSECVSSLKSANSAKQPKVKPPKKSKASKAPKKSNQATSVKTPCSICQQKLKSAKVKSPKSAKVSKPAKSAEFPCGVCQQKIMSSDSSSSLVISATSVESTKPAKVSNPSKPPKSVEFPCGICQQKLMSSESSIHSISATSANSSKVKCPPIISPGDSPKPIRRTVVKLKDPGSYKPDQEGVISVEQYEKNKRKKKKTKQLSTDMCLPICRQDKKNKKEQYQVVDCVKVSRAVKGAIIRCKCAIPESSKCTKKSGVCQCLAPDSGSDSSYKKSPDVCEAPAKQCPELCEAPAKQSPELCEAPAEQSPELCEDPANRGLKVQVHRKVPTELAAWSPLFNKC